MWRVIFNLHPAPGAFQMAADEFLAQASDEPQWSGILRFYQWSPPAISLGIHQSPDRVDWERCHELGWDVVRRPTGGRALLHYKDLSFALIFLFGAAPLSTYGRSHIENGIKRANGAFSPLSFMRSSYQEVSETIAQGLAEWGVTASFTARNGGTSPLYFHPHLIGLTGSTPKASVGGYICQATQVRGELNVGGKKIAGIALRLYPHSLLIHGSLFLLKAPFIGEGLKLNPEEREKLAQYLAGHTTSLEECIGYVPDPYELAQSIVEVFKKRERCSLCCLPLDEKEREAIQPRTPLYQLQVSDPPVVQSHPVQLKSAS